MFNKWRLSTLAIVVALSGCASLPEESADLDRSIAPVEIAAAPFYPQEEYQCGPAALATALVQSGVATSASELGPQVYLPGRQGSLQPELLAATRAADRIPYVIDPSVSAIYAELASGRPVVVLQNLGISQLPRWHYAVVVGIDPGLGKVYLRSGTEKRRETKLKTFLRTWQRSDFWAFVTLQPGELPAQPEPMRYAEAVAAVEAAGHDRTAHASWLAAVQRWPEHPVALFGLANAELSASNYEQAEALYRRLLANDSGNLLAANNLALALAYQARHAEALQQIKRVIANVGANDPLRPEYLRTLQEIRQMPKQSPSSRDLAEAS